MKSTLQSVKVGELLWRLLDRDNMLKKYNMVAIVNWTN